MKEYIMIIAASFVIGFVADCIFGDPKGFPHSINLIGNSVKKLEKILRKNLTKTDKLKSEKQVAKIEQRRGLILVIIICISAFSISSAIIAAAFMISKWLCIVIQSFMIWQIIAAKSLMIESKKVYEPLKENNLEEARLALSMIVGRDTWELDEEGVTKAAVETVAENTSDGVIAPMLYVFFGGAPFGYLYKAINTMDSILGYKNEKYLNFGRCAAKLDDIANFIPARISALLMILGSFLCGYDGKNAIKIFKRDRYKHQSPNSAQTESVCAGALGIRLAGDAKYFGKIYKKQYIGDPIKKIEAEDILKAHRLMYAATFILVIIFCLIWLIAIL